MQFVALVSWWYGLGWLDQVSLVRQRFTSTADRYSLGMLVRTLFSPFKQLDATSGRGGSLDTRMRAWLDRQISRFIGAMIRSFMIVVGLMALLIEGIAALTRLVVWPLLPIFPIIGFVLALSGWLPWR